MNLTDWHVAVAMARTANGNNKPLERRTFTTTIPATSEAYALIGAHEFGNAINLGSNRAWKFDGERCITATEGSQS